MKEGLPAKKDGHEKPLVKDEWFTDDRISVAADEMRSAQAELDALQDRTDAVHPAEMAAAEARVQAAHERMAKTWSEVSSEGGVDESSMQNEPDAESESTEDALRVEADVSEGIAAANAARALEHERARKVDKKEKSVESAEQAPRAPEQSQESKTEEMQEKPAAEPVTEDASSHGMFGDFRERFLLWRENRGLASSSRELSRLQQVLREKEEQLAGITGEFELYGSEVAGLKGPYKIPDRAELQAGKDKAEIVRREARLRDEIADTKRQIEMQEKDREARDAAAVLILEKAAKRADAITRPHREQLAEMTGMLDGANDHLTRYRDINQRVEQQLKEWNVALKGVRSSADKITLKTWIKKHATLRGRLEKRIAYWERKVADLESKRDRAGARIEERERLVDEMHAAHDQAFDAGQKAMEDAEAAAVSRVAHEVAAEKPADPKDFLKVWNGRFGGSLPLGEHELDGLLSASPSYREIETAAALKLGWKRGFLWKLPLFSQLWDLRTRRRMSVLRSLLNNKK